MALIQAVVHQCGMGGLKSSSCHRHGTTTPVMRTTGISQIRQTTGIFYLGMHRNVRVLRPTGSSLPGGAIIKGISPLGPLSVARHTVWSFGPAEGRGLCWAKEKSMEVLTAKLAGVTYSNLEIFQSQSYISPPLYLMHKISLSME